MSSQRWWLVETSWWQRNIGTYISKLDDACGLYINRFFAGAGHSVFSQGGAWCRDHVFPRWDKRWSWVISGRGFLTKVEYRLWWDKVYAFGKVVVCLVHSNCCIHYLIKKEIVILLSYRHKHIVEPSKYCVFFLLLCFISCAYVMGDCWSLISGIRAHVKSNLCGYAHM